MLMSLVAACGGEDSSSFPKVSGASKVTSSKPSQEDLDEMGVEVSNAESTIYKSDKSVEEVAEFYSDGVKDDGWNVDQNIPMGDGSSVSIISKGKSIAAVYVLSGAAAKENQSLFDDEDLDFNPDEIDDDETVILEVHFDCEEDVVATCMTALMQS